jgi:hypothetical protein
MCGKLWQSLGSVALLTIIAATAHAGTMTPSLQVMHRYDLNTSAPLPLVFAGPDVAHGQPGLYEVGVFFTATKDAATEKGWLSAAFGTSITDFFTAPGQLTLDGATGWFPNLQTTDTNGPSIGGAKAVFQTNQDAGTPSDLQGIVVAIESALIAGAAQGGNAFELRNELGTANAPATAGYKDPLDAGAPAPATGFPTYIGSFFVRWTGEGRSSANLINLQYAFSLLNGTPTNALDDSPGQTINASGGNGVRVWFGEIPEPATGAMLIVSWLSIAVMRRRKASI